MFGHKQQHDNSIIAGMACDYRVKLEEAGFGLDYIIAQLLWMSDEWGSDLPVAAKAYADEAQRLQAQAVEKLTR